MAHRTRRGLQRRSLALLAMVLAAGIPVSRAQLSKTVDGKHVTGEIAVKRADTASAKARLKRTAHADGKAPEGPK